MVAASLRGGQRCARVVGEKNLPRTTRMGTNLLFGGLVKTTGKSEGRGKNGSCYRVGDE